MIDPSIDYFRIDDSAQGTAKVNGPPTSTTDPTPVKVYDIQCYVAVRLGKGTTFSTIITDVGPFVKCVHRNTFALFVKLEDFKARIGAADYATLLATYQKDWAVGNDKPAFPGWGENGQQLVTWPAQGIIAKESSKDRYGDQRSIWIDVAQHAEDAGSRARLWEPKEPLTPRWKVYFVPGGAWLSPQALQHILDRLAAQEKARNSSMNLTSWLDFSAISQEEATARAAKNEILPISTNLFGHYITYTTVGDVKAMIAAQTEKRNRNCWDGWLRVLPEEKSVSELEDKLKDHRSLLTLTKTSLKLPGDALDFAGGDDIMGVPANDWARGTLWPGEDVKDVGAWLHRSDPKFGPLLNGDWQSVNNVFFGTYESHSNINRAVSLISLVLKKTNAASGKGWQGFLITRAVRKGNVDYINSAGLASVFPIPPWISESKSAWLVPSLLYTGSFQIPTDVSTPFAGPPLMWDTQYSAFSCYSPLVIEGKLDHLILDIYLAKHFGLKRWHGVEHPQVPKAIYDSLNLPATTALPASAFDLQSSTTTLGTASQASNGPDTATATISNPRQPQPNSTYGSYDRLSQVMKHPVHQLAWQAASQGRAEVNLGGVVIKNPRIAQKPQVSDSADPTTSTPPSDGFALTGSINLFGLDKPVQLVSWHGPPPSHVIFGKELPTCQHVQVDTLFASELLPLLAGTPFNSFQFKDVVITYQNYAFEPTKPLGWSMTATLSLGPEHGSVFHVLKDVLQIPMDSFQMRVSSSLGLGYSWAKQPAMSTLFIEGVLNISSPLSLCKGVLLSRIGLRLSAIQSTTSGLGGKPVMKCGYSIVGDMHVDAPASKQPVEFDFVIDEVDGDVELNASLKSDKWENAFGSGITLETASLSLLLDTSKPRDAWSFYLQAELSTGDSVTHLGGYCTVGGQYNFQATIKNFGVSGLLKFFAHHFPSQSSLSPPTQLDFSIGSATISIQTDNGLVIEVDSLEFEGYRADSARIQVSSAGVTVEGSIAEVKFPEVDIISLKEASIRLSFEKTDSGRSSEIVLAGQLEIDELDFASISAVVHLYKAAGAGKMEWTVYGQFEELGDSTSLGVLFKELKGTPLGSISLQGLALIAASKDDPALSAMNPQKYDIHQGVQICATVGEVTSFRKLLRRPTPGLILNAGYSKAKKFSLDISVPDDTVIHLGKGITTDPITLAISTTPVQLQISAGLKVPVPHAADPLDFRATLAIIDETVSIAGEMQGLWKDPFGIGESVSVGPDLALKLGIDLPIFFVTGVPNEFAFQGGLSIGNVDGQVMFEVSEDPTQELLSGALQKLSILDVVAFLRRVTGLDIHDPSDFLDFLRVQFYMSTGATIGAISYPAGFSFEADILLFGTQIHAGAAIANSSLLVKGSIGELPVGPLKIKGSGTNGVAMDLEIGSAAAKMTLDGMFTVLGSDISILLDLELLPKPVFKFDFALQFTDLLVFNVDAIMLGVVDLKDLSHLDFQLHALFEQHMLSYLRDQLAKMVETCKLKEQSAIDEAKKKVEEEKNKLTAAIDKAQADLDAKYQTWTAHQDEVNNASGAVVTQYQASLKRLQDAVDVERSKYDLALKSAENAVQHANADRADKMRQAEAAVTNAKNAWDADVAQKEKDLESKKAAFNQKFGNAEKDIENAKAKVDSIQNDINGVQGKINDYEHAKWTQFWKKAAIPELYVALGTLKVSKGVADGVLTACEAVVRSIDYVTVKGAIPIAEDAVAAAGKAGNAAFNDATDAVKAADRISGAAVDLAEKTLDGVQKGGDAALRGAQATLDQFIKAQKAILDAAQKAIDDLVKGVEWLAYQAASAALDLAKHSTAALDVATRALDLVEKGSLELLKLGEEALEKLMSTLDIQKLELDGTLSGLLGGSGKHFTISVEGLFASKPFKYDDIELNLKDITQFAHDIFVRLDKLI